MRTRKIKIIMLMSLPLFAAALISPLSARGGYQKKTDYSRFTHKTHSGDVRIPDSQETQELKCDSCHERRVSGAPANRSVATTEHNDRLQVNYPGHSACVECHITQFTARQTCAICHSQELSSLPPQRDFPARHDYNAYFDGQQHVDHLNKYPLPDGAKLDCGYCHKPTVKQMARSIASHQECYVCHAPGSGDAKASLKAGCGVCHRPSTVEKEIEPFSSKYKSRAYGALFSHQTHISYAGGKCDECHTIEGRYNQPLPAPGKIRVKNHLSTGERSGRGCFSCHDGGTHDGRAVFSGEDAGACVKCHKTQDKKGRPLVLPTEG